MEAAAVADVLEARVLVLELTWLEVLEAVELTAIVVPLVATLVVTDAVGTLPIGLTVEEVTRVEEAEDPFLEDDAVEVVRVVPPELTVVLSSVVLVASEPPAAPEIVIDS